jgi:hypothetical protein
VTSLARQQGDDAMNAHVRRLALTLGGFFFLPSFLPVATARAQDSSATRGPSPSTPGAAHERLTAFEGTWRRISDPGGRTVVDTCAWLAGSRRHMVCRQRVERPGGVSEQMAVYSYRGADSTYTLTVFLSGGQVWRYAGRPEASRWTFYRLSNRPDAPSRLRQIVVASGDTLRFVEEISEDGSTWRLSDPSEDFRSVRVERSPK